MTAPDSRNDRILELIIDKVFGEINEADERELNELLESSGEVRTQWERLMDPENLMDFISEQKNDGPISDLEAAKEKFDKLIGKKR